MFALLGLTHSFFFSVAYHTGFFSYFQYIPIRTIFGTFFLLFSFRYLRHMSPIKYHFGFFVSALSVLWCLDTGFVILLSWLSLLIYDTYIKNKNILHIFIISLKHISYGLLYSTAIFLTYGILAYLFTGKLVLFSKTFEYSSIFYKYGFGMFPMPLIGLWLLPAFIYLTYLTNALIFMFKRKDSLFTKFHFFISVFGIGIFSYYQGRSYLLNLFVVSYPALLLLYMSFGKFLLQNRFSFTLLQKKVGILF